MEKMKTRKTIGFRSVFMNIHEKTKKVIGFISCWMNFFRKAYKANDFLSCFMDIHDNASKTSSFSSFHRFSIFCFFLFDKFLLTSLAGAQDEEIDPDVWRRHQGRWEMCTCTCTDILKDIEVEAYTYLDRSASLETTDLKRLNV